MPIFFESQQCLIEISPAFNIVALSTGVSLLQDISELRLLSVTAANLALTLTIPMAWKEVLPLTETILKSILPLTYWAPLYAVIEDVEVSMFVCSISSSHSSTHPLLQHLSLTMVVAIVAIFIISHLMVEFRKSQKSAFHRAATWSRTCLPVEVQGTLVKVTLQTSALTFWRYFDSKKQHVCLVLEEVLRRVLNSQVST